MAERVTRETRIPNRAYSGEITGVCLYSRGQTKTTILVIIIWGPCTTLDSTFYCRNVEIRTQRFDLYEPIFQNRWNEKFYPKNIGQTLNGPLKSWKIAQLTPFSTLHLILKLRGSSDGLFLQKKMILNHLKWQLRVFPPLWPLIKPRLLTPLLSPLLAHVH